MTTDFYHKKQIVFPGIILRVVTSLLDFTVVAILISPLIQILVLKLFNIYFADFLLSHNLEVKSPDDIRIVITHDDFTGYLNNANYLSYFFIISVAQFFMYSIYFIISWWKFGTTIVKYIFKMRIIDYRSQSKPTLINCIIRYFI